MNLHTKIKEFILNSVFTILCAIWCIFLIAINEKPKGETDDDGIY